MISRIQLIDTHAHLCDPQFDEDRSAVLERAQSKGIQWIVEIGESPESWEKAKQFAEDSHSDLKTSFHTDWGSQALRTQLQKPLAFWTCGFHPHYAQRMDQFDFGIMTKFAFSPLCVAIGEIGLDFVKSTASREDQISLFRKCLEVAAELNKPVVIHCREAQADTLRILKSFFGGMGRKDICPGVIHCFSGDLGFAEGCMDLGFYLGVDGPLTYPSAKNLREVLSKAPENKIVLETDAPYLPPQGYRGKRNESSYLILIAEALANLYGKSLDEIARITTQNALKLFRLHEYNK